MESFSGSRPTFQDARYIAAIALASSVAQAQLPGIRRKVRDAGRQAVTGRSARGAPPQFDNTMLELNPGVVARFLKGLEARSCGVEFTS